MNEPEDDFDEDDLKLDPHFAERFEHEDKAGCQLYLISPPSIDDGFAAKLAEALDAGPVAAFQLRLKGIDDHAIAALAPPLQKICADRDVAFIVNDSIGLAKRLKADGVHLGQDDGDPRDAREQLGRDAQIGVTCHDSRHLAMEAGEAGADYVAFGAFYPTDTKEVKHRAEPSILGWWSTVTGIPCVAIGGITPGNAAPLVEAGADFLAVSGAVWNDPEGPGAAVAKFAGLLTRN
ncbi:thiamine-phosphate synthase [Sphingomonas sp. DBB INV C78]|uniref:thiamine phosphate synthase n=1 Tax=Sphingomonas sp. DBB INV C78 TaxID=3349434 RepID=UPI0036D38B07